MSSRHFQTFRCQFYWKYEENIISQFTFLVKPEYQPEMDIVAW